MYGEATMAYTTSKNCSLHAGLLGSCRYFMRQLSTRLPPQNLNTYIFCASSKLLLYNFAEEKSSKAHTECAACAVKINWMRVVDQKLIIHWSGLILGHSNNGFRISMMGRGLLVIRLRPPPGVSCHLRGKKQCQQY